MIPPEKLPEFAVFAGLPAAALAPLAERMREDVYSAGDTIFKEGVAGDAMYFVSKGHVVIRKAIDRDRGIFKNISVIGPRDFFGEMSLLEEGARSADAAALTDATLYRLSHADFQKTLEGDPSSAFHLFRGLVGTLSTRLRQTTREMVAVFEVGRMLTQELDVKGLASRILGAIRNVFEPDVSAAFYLWNEFTVEYEFAAAEGPWPEGLRRSKPKDDVLFRVMQVRRECLLLDDLAGGQMPDGARAAWPGLHSFLSAPVLGVKGTMGYMVFAAARPGLLGAGHRQVAAGVANLVAPAFENAAWRQELDAKRRLERSKTTAY